MTIKMRQAPASGVDVLSKGLDDLSSLDNVASMLGGAPTKAAHPIPLYSVGLTDLAKGAAIEGAQQIGWRYLVFGPQTVGIADLNDVGGKGDPRFGGFYVGQRAQCLNFALKYAEDAYRSGEGIYEVRILELPALYTAAVWLAGSDNIFIPFLENGKLCSIKSVGQEQFLSDVEQRARTQQEYLRRDGEKFREQA